MRVWLLDTGPLVAYLDPRDQDHARVVATLEEIDDGLWAIYFYNVQLARLQERDFKLYA